MRYAKILENGSLEYAPRNIDGVSNWIEDVDAVKAAGYLPVKEEAIPEGCYTSSYREVDGTVCAVYDKLPEATYIEKRLSAYPPIPEQLDMIYWDKVNGTDLWKEKIAEIKAAYPKPDIEEAIEDGLQR